jgi:archaellum biogenesis protein FlaJ (TadC family)
MKDFIDAKILGANPKALNWQSLNIDIKEITTWNEMIILFITLHAHILALVALLITHQLGILPLYLLCLYAVTPVFLMKQRKRCTISNCSP